MCAWGARRARAWACTRSPHISALPCYRYYAKAVNCCFDVRSLLDADDPGICPPVGPCRGFEGLCADIPAQFATVPVLPDYPNGLQDYTCHAFPDDDNPVDSFLVGLIALAVALPCTLFLGSAFELANDSEAPKSWLEWSGLVPKLVFGFRGHHRWHYTRGPKPPPWFVLWYVRNYSSPNLELLIDFCKWLVAKVLRRDPEWVIEGRERQEAEAEKREAFAEAFSAKPSGEAEHDSPHATKSGGSCKSGSGSGSGSSQSSMAEARESVAFKHFLTYAGLLGTAVTWALFAWCVHQGGASVGAVRRILTVLLFLLILAGSSSPVRVPCTPAALATRPCGPCSLVAEHAIQ